MVKSFKYKILILAFCVIGITAFSQDTEQAENQFIQAGDNSITSTNIEEQNNTQPSFIDKPNKNLIDNYSDAVNEQLYSPESDVSPDIAKSWQEESQPKILIQKQKAYLKDYGATNDDNTAIWMREDAKDRAIIEQTVHRKREIDPKKLGKLTNISKILGSLHALRISCVGEGDQTYRSKMNALLDLEAPSAEYIRDPLIIAFNTGFESQGQGQNQCPEDKSIIEAKLAKQGRITALEMINFYEPKTKLNHNKNP